MNAEEFREYLIIKINSTADWRSQKADEFPADDRNEKSAKTLSQLPRSLLEIPVTDRLFTLCWAEIEWHTRKGQDLEEGIEEQLLMVDSFVSRYGFDSKKSGDGRQFLSELGRFLNWARLRAA